MIINIKLHCCWMDTKGEFVHIESTISFSGSRKWGSKGRLT